MRKNFAFPQQKSARLVKIMNTLNIFRRRDVTVRLTFHIYLCRPLDEMKKNNIYKRQYGRYVLVVEN